MKILESLNLKSIRLTFFLLVLYLLTGCHFQSQSYNWELDLEGLKIKDGEQKKTVFHLNKNKVYLVKYLDADCSDCIMKLSQAFELYDRINNENLNLLIIGKGRSEKRFEFAFHNYKYPDYFSFDESNKIETIFLAQLNSTDPYLLIDHSGKVYFEGYPDSRLIEFNNALSQLVK